MLNILKAYFQQTKTVYVFHHIPKCGGNAIRTALKKWFKIKTDYLTREQLMGNEKLNPPLDLSKLKPYHCLCGHFEVNSNHLDKRYPQIFTDSCKFKVFTFIRDPFELRKSLYYYQIKTKIRDPNKETLEKYLLKHDNYLSNRFPCTQENYKKVLDRYLYIGLQETSQDSMDRLASILNKPKIKLSIENVSVRDSQDSEVDQNLIEQFREKNELDYMIYTYVKSKFA